MSLADAAAGMFEDGGEGPGMLSPEDLLAGSSAVFEVVVPPEVLRPAEGGEGEGRAVRIRPLSIGAFGLILKAARADPGLIPLLMIKEALVSPRLSLDQVRAMHLGLVNFLIAHVREVSGLGQKKNSGPP